MMKLTVAMLALTIAALSAKSAELERIEPDSALSGSITKYAKQFNVERDILSCVLYVESRYIVNVISETQDYGAAQVNIKTIKRYNFSINELLTNGDYNVKAAAMVLSDYRIAFRSDEINDWVARYNIGYQSLNRGSIGALYVAYNNKVRACISAGVGL